MDHVVSEIQHDSVQREIGVLDLLGEHDVAIAIVTSKRSGSVGTYGELPDLKFLGGDSLVEWLNDRDFVQKPIRSAVFGNVLRAGGVQNIAVDRMAIPVVAAGELCQVGLAESLRRHNVPLFFEVTPRRGRERQQEQPFRRRGVTGKRGINEGQPVGNHRLCRESALDVSLRLFRLTATRPLVGHRKRYIVTKTALRPVVSTGRRTGSPFSRRQLRLTAKSPFALVAYAGVHICGGRRDRTRSPIANHHRIS